MDDFFNRFAFDISDDDEIPDDDEPIETIEYDWEDIDDETE